VSPYEVGCQTIFTQVDGDKPIFNNRIYTTVDGTSGLGQNPVHPHTTTKEARTCADCHMSRKALGLGSGYYISRDNGLDIDFELERIVDEEGNQIQETAHVGARPFNKAEMQRIDRSGTCIACHGSKPEFWEKVKGKAKVKGAPDDDAHRKAIGRILNKAAK
jgi:mono/diheme cytochrome c family protein